MTRIRIRALCLTALMIVAASPAFGLDLGGHDRDGAVIGLTFGHGWNSIKFTPVDGTAQETGNISAFTGGFRFGWASTDNFIVSVGMYGWRKRYQTLQYLSTSSSNYNFVLEGFWFPRGEGFWIKGGFGRGTLDFTGTAVLPQDTVNFNESGWAMTAGLGYEFRISDGAALGICYDLIYLPVGDFAGFSDVQSISNSLSLNFHFYL